MRLKVKCSVLSERLELLMLIIMVLVLLGVRFWTIIMGYDVRVVIRALADLMSSL